jgi:hypothetical protein
MAAVDVVDAFLGPLPSRRLGHGEWGLTLPAETAGGWPLDVGLRITDELLRVQAFAAPADAAPDHGQLLFWNRHTRLVRFAVSQSGDVWIQADVPVPAVDERMLDRVLGLVVEAAVAVRTPVPEPGEGGGWLPVGPGDAA